MPVSPRSFETEMAGNASQTGAFRPAATCRGGFWTLVAAGCLVSSLSAPAAAQGFQGDILEGTLQALGLADAPPKPEIDYRERAPLVVPPAAGEALPAPVEKNAAANPNWPKDPDVERRKRESEASNQPIIRDDAGRPLMPSELNKGRKKISSSFPSAAPTEPVDSTASGTKRDLVLPSQLGFKGWDAGALWGQKEKPLTFEGEPTRESLVQPPPGYQTPAPNAPYGVVEPKKDEPFKFPTLFDRE